VTPDRVAAACVSALLLLTAVTVFIRRDSRDVAARSTITLFALVWGISLGAYAIPWIDYSRPSGLAWAAVYGSLISFLVACAFAERIARPTEALPTREHLRPARLHVAVIITAVLGYIGFAFFVLAINKLVGWKTLFTDLHRARTIQETPEFGKEYGTVKVLTYFSGVSLLLWTIAVRERLFRGKWLLVAPLGPLVLLPYLFLGERISLLTVGMWIAAVHLVWRPIRSPGRAALVIVVAASAALGFFYWVGYHKGATIQNHPELRSHLRTREFEELAFPYMYLTANTPVLSKLMQDPIAPRTRGALTFWPAAKLSNLALRRTDYPPKYGAFYDIPFDAYNSATWLGPFYLDFGFIGCLVFPALFGFATTWILGLARECRTLLSAWAAGIALTIIAYSPLKNAFSDAGTWALLIVAPFVCGFVTQRSPTSDPHAASQIGRTVRKRPWAAGVAVALVAGIVFAAIVLRLTRPPIRTEATTQVVSKELIQAGQKVLRVYEEEGGDSSSHALATRLAVSDPEVNYEWIDASEEPLPDVVGVVASRTEFRLRARTSGGRVLEVIGVKGASGYRLAGPRILGAGLVANGGFEEPFGPPWVISSRAGVDVATTANALDGAYSLRIKYERGATRKATSVSQLIRGLPERAPGSRFTMNEVIVTMELSRPVVYGLQLIYRDGSTQYFAGATNSSNRASTLIGTSARSTGPEIVTASGVALKRVSSVRVFAVDAGSKAVTGSVTVDDVQLRSREPSRHR
jgi:oligosaccharide repeat unit polymerase